MVARQGVRVYLVDEDRRKLGEGGRRTERHIN